VLVFDSGMPFHIHCCKEGKRRNSRMSIWQFVPGTAVPRQRHADLYHNCCTAKGCCEGWCSQMYIRYGIGLGTDIPFVCQV